MFLHAFIWNMVILIQGDLALRQNPIQDYTLTELKSRTSVWILHKLLEVPSGDIISPKVSGTSSLFAFYTCYNERKP